MKLKRPVPLILVWLCISLPGFSQSEPYIRCRKVFNPAPSCLALSPDGKLLLAGFTDGTFRVLDPGTLEASLEVEEAHSKAITAMDMPPKMDFILTAGGKEIKLWNREGKQVGELTGHATSVWNADISRDGKRAVSSAFNKTFLLWDVYNGTITEPMRGHEDVTLAVAFSPDDQWIASGSNDHTIKIWNPNTREIVFTLNGPVEDIYDLAFSPDSRLLAAASGEHGIRVYDLEEHKLAYLLKGHRDAVKRLDFSPDSRYLASASMDKSAILWDMVKGEKIHTYLDGEGMVLDVVFSTDGQSIYTASASGNLTCWKVDPEIFVLKYYGQSYMEEIDTDSIFQPRGRGEPKKEYQARMKEADRKRAEIVDRYFRQYLQERDH
jgi:WD40 repeat protein